MTPFWGLPPPPSPLYQRQIFVKKGPKEDSKTRAWLDFRAFSRVPGPLPQDPKNGPFWGSPGSPWGPQKWASRGPWAPGAPDLGPHAPNWALTGSGPSFDPLGQNPTLRNG